MWLTILRNLFVIWAFNVMLLLDFKLYTFVKLFLRLRLQYWKWICKVLKYWKCFVVFQWYFALLLEKCIPFLFWMNLCVTYSTFSRLSDSHVQRYTRNFLRLIQKNKSTLYKPYKFCIFTPLISVFFRRFFFFINVTLIL